MFKSYEDLIEFLRNNKDLGYTLSYLQKAVDTEGLCLGSVEDAQEHYTEEINYFIDNEFKPTPMTFMGYRRKPHAWAIAQTIKEYKCKQQHPH